MKTLKVKISDTKYNDLLNYISSYEIPTSKILQDKIRAFIANTLMVEVLDGYTGFDHTEFYTWIEDKVAKKFKLKEYGIS